ncbi:MAG: hypothetical protein WD208_10950 [Dehalococcoidia bacterium]
MGHVILRAIFILALAVGMLAGVDKTAHACSCIIGDPRTRLEEADAALIGRLISHTEPQRNSQGGLSSATLVTWTFEVETAVKGEFGSHVEIKSPWGGPSCGFEVPEGEPVGLFLRQGDDGSWRGGLCGQIDPDVLLRAAEPLPPPDGSGPIAFLLGGRFGEARMMALDALGRTLAYGWGEGPTAGISMCPGEAHAVEVYGDIQNPRVGARDLRTFESVSDAAIGDLDFTANPTGQQYGWNTTIRTNSFGGVLCLDEEGKDFVFFATPPASEAESLVVRVTDGTATVLWRGIASNAAFVPGSPFAYLSTSDVEHRILELDLESAETRQVAAAPAEAGEELRTLAVSPGGERVAVVATKRPSSSYSRAARLIVAYMSNNPVTVLDKLLKNEEFYGDILWPDDETLAVVPSTGEVGIQVFDASLNEISSWTSSPSVGNPVVVDDVVYGTQWGAVASAPLDTGPFSKLREFDSREFWSFTAVPGEVHVTPQEAPRQQPTEPQSQDTADIAPESNGSSTWLMSAGISVGVVTLLYLVARWGRRRG